LFQLILAKMISDVTPDAQIAMTQPKAARILVAQLQVAPGFPPGRTSNLILPADRRMLTAWNGGQTFCFRNWVKPLFGRIIVGHRQVTAL
jgi:hypothetical protein